MKFLFLASIASALKITDKKPAIPDDLLKNHEDLMCAIGGKNPFNPGQALM